MYLNLDLNLQMESAEEVVRGGKWAFVVKFERIITSGRKVSDAYQDAGDVYMSQNTGTKHEIQKKG